MRKRVYFGLFDGEKCPYCGSRETLYDNYHRDWYCKKCKKYFG